MYGSTTKGDVVKRPDCILVYGSTTKGDVVKRSNSTYLYVQLVQVHTRDMGGCTCTVRT